MKYNININQKAIIESGLPLQLEHAAILDFIVSISAFDKAIKLNEGAYTYYLLSSTFILEQLPLLRVGKDRVYRLLKQMQEMGLIEPNSNNQKLGGSYYRLTSKATQFEFSNTYVKNTEPPTVKTTDNNSIIDNTNIKDATLEKVTAIIMTKAAPLRTKAESLKPLDIEELIPMWWADRGELQDYKDDNHIKNSFSLYLTHLIEEKQKKQLAKKATPKAQKTVIQSEDEPSFQSKEWFKKYYNLDITEENTRTI
jgi:hypothetical protein